MVFLKFAKFAVFGFDFCVIGVEVSGLVVLGLMDCDGFGVYGGN